MLSKHALGERQTFIYRMHFMAQIDGKLSGFAPGQSYVLIQGLMTQEINPELRRSQGYTSTGSTRMATPIDAPALI